MVATDVPPGPALSYTKDLLATVHSESTGNALIDKWSRFSMRLNHAHQLEAQEYMVARARRIWGRLGLLLRRSIWAKFYRARKFVPVFITRIVKKWVHRQQ